MIILDSTPGQVDAVGRNSLVRYRPASYNPLQKVSAGPAHIGNFKFLHRIGIIFPEAVCISQW
jgi:hypothetical protein